VSTERELWRHRDFLRLWAAQAVSAFGARITRTALPIIAVETLHAPEATVAALVAVNLLPSIILSLFAGGYVDRGRKRRIMIGSDIARAGIIATLTIAWAADGLVMPHVVAVGMLVGAASALFTIADAAYLPSLIAPHQLAEGNAKLQTTEAIAEVSGPASAGLLIAALGAPLAVIINAATYVWSAVMLGRIRGVDEVPPPTVERASVVEDLRIGLRAIFGHELVRPTVIASAFALFAGGFFATLYTLYCFRVLQLDESTFGIVIAMGGIGAVIGSQIARPIARALGLGPTLVLSATLSLAAALFIPLARGPEAFKIACLAFHQLFSDGLWMVFVIHTAVVRQTVMPKEVLGRANAASFALTVGMMPIAALLAGALAELTSIRAAVWVGVSAGLLGVPFLFPLWKLRELPTDRPQPVAAR
jgi:MFS family permease